MNLIVSIIAIAMLAMIVSRIICSLSSTEDEATKKPVEETSDMKLRKAYRNAYYSGLQRGESEVGVRKSKI